MASFRGKFVWYELMTSDTAAAERFYKSVLGWGARDAGVPGMAYTLFSAGAADVGGMMALPPGARPGWMGYVAVDDVDASARQVTEAGGKIHHPPGDIPNVGRFAVVADPQGAALALFKGMGDPPPSAPMAAPGMAAPGHVGWHELYAADREAAFAFYAALFGWTKGEAIDLGPMGTYQIFAQGTEALGGMMTKPEMVPAPFWQYYFNVENIDAAATRVTQGGGQILMGPHQVPGGSWILQCLDPQGAPVALAGSRG